MNWWARLVRIDSYGDKCFSIGLKPEKNAFRIGNLNTDHLNLLISDFRFNISLSNKCTFTASNTSNTS